MDKIYKFMKNWFFATIILLTFLSVLLIFEDDLNNKSRYSPPKIILPDLYFPNITYSTSFINTTANMTYWNVSVLTTLRNRGTFPSGISVTSIRIGGNGYNSSRMTMTPTIPVMGSLNFLESFVGVTGQYNVLFYADFFNNVTELSESNNLIGTAITLP